MTTELEALTLLLESEELAKALHHAPGGWRDLSRQEIEYVIAQPERRRTLIALQALARPYRELRRHRLTTPEDVAAVYMERLGGLITETMFVIAVDGRRHVLTEIEVARGGRHGLALTACDILRPLIRSGASAFLLVHNHPSGDPRPSPDDVEMTTLLEAAADIVGVPLLDHLVVAGGGGGWCSMLELGFIDHKENHHERTGKSPRALAAEGR